MSKNTKLFLMVMVLFVLIAAVVMISTTSGNVLAGANLNGFCVPSGAGSCSIGY
jgi:hypothetical protein